MRFISKLGEEKKKEKCNSLSFINFNINLFISYRALNRKSKKRYNLGPKPCFIREMNRFCVSM